MSIPLEPIDMSAVAVGVSGTVDWVGEIQQGSPLGVRPGKAHLRILNESGAGLTIYLGAGNSGFHMAAGGWQDAELNGESSFRWMCTYLQQGPSPNLLLVTLYQAGEMLPPPPILGNSPVSVGNTVTTGANVTSASQLQFDATAINGEQINSVEDTAAAGGAAPLVDVTRKNATGGKQKFVMSGGECDINSDGSVTAPAFHGPVDNASNATNLGSAITAFDDATNHAVNVRSLDPSGSARSFVVHSWDGTNDHVPFSVGTNGARALCWVDDNSNVTAPAFHGPADKVVAATGLSANDQFGWATAANGYATRHVSHFTGSGSGTFSHGMSGLSGAGTPNHCNITTSLVNSTQTVGFDSLGSSTVHVNTGAGYQWSGEVAVR